MRTPPTTLTTHQLDALIYEVREQRVMLDSDLAEIYSVPTKRLLEQVRRNVDRFPEDFAFQITREEYQVLRSQIATLKDRPWSASQISAVRFHRAWRYHGGQCA